MHPLMHSLTSLCMHLCLSFPAAWQSPLQKSSPLRRARLWRRTELFPYETCIFFTVVTALITLPRQELKAKVVDAPEILTIISTIPHLESFLNSFYACRYADFLQVSLQSRISDPSGSLTLAAGLTDLWGLCHLCSSCRGPSCLCCSSMPSMLGLTACSLCLLAAESSCAVTHHRVYPRKPLSGCLGFMQHAVHQRPSWPWGSIFRLFSTLRSAPQIVKQKAKEGLCAGVCSSHGRHQG